MNNKNIFLKLLKFCLISYQNIKMKKTKTQPDSMNSQHDLLNQYYEIYSEFQLKFKYYISYLIVTSV